MTLSGHGEKKVATGRSQSHLWVHSHWTKPAVQIITTTNRNRIAQAAAAQPIAHDKNVRSCAVVKHFPAEEICTDLHTEEFNRSVVQKAMSSTTEADVLDATEASLSSTDQAKFTRSATFQQIW